MDYLVFEPSDEDIAEFGSEALSAAWAQACNYFSSYDAMSRPDDAL